MDARRVVLGRSGPMILGIGSLIHVLTIAVVWSVGRAQGLVLPLPDAAVLLMVMVGVALVPISISGWGLRELAIVSSSKRTTGSRQKRPCSFSSLLRPHSRDRLAARRGGVAGMFIWASAALRRARRMNGTLIGRSVRPRAAHFEVDQ